MEVHMGKIIHGLVKDSGIKAGAIAKGVHISESTLYKDYKRKVIEIPRLIAYSIFFKKNLLEHYLKEDELKTIFNSDIESLANENEKLKEMILSKDKRIQELEDVVSTQKRALDILERGTRKKKWIEMPAFQIRQD